MTKQSIWAVFAGVLVIIVVTTLVDVVQVVPDRARRAGDPAMLGRRQDLSAAVGRPLTC
jgi:hypothetical protein